MTPKCPVTVISYGKICIGISTAAQWLAAQPVPRAMSIGDLPMRRIREQGPLGHIRFLITILAGNLKFQSGVLSLSLGQGLPPER
jgi:hypothetical protein